MNVFVGTSPPSYWVRAARHAARAMGLGAVVVAVATGFTTLGVVLGVVGLSSAAALGFWGAHRGAGRLLGIELTDRALRFSDGREHTFGSKSLVALRVANKEFESRTDATVVLVPLDTGGERALAFMDLLEDGSYGGNERRDPDVWFDPDQNALLQSLGAQLGNTKGPRYTMSLQGPQGEEWP